MTKIEWTDATWNPILRNVADRDKVEIGLDEKTLMQPLRWRKPRMVFVCSMTDLFGDWVSDWMIDKVFAVMALCPQHIFQILTKRPERMREYADGANRAGEHWLALEDSTAQWPLPNVWMGVSVEDQHTADQRIPHLLATPAVQRFISAEPLLGPVDLRKIHRGNGVYLDASAGFDWDELGVRSEGPSLGWVICGGESGPNARPMHPDWARSLRDQCAAADVPFFFKQWGEWRPFAGCPDGYVQTFLFFTHPGSDFGETVARVGKKRAGHLLDGHQHHAWPEVQS